MFMARMATWCYRITSFVGFICSFYLLILTKGESFFNTSILTLWTIISVISVIRMICDMVGSNHAKERRFEDGIKKWQPYFKNKYIGILAFIGVVMLMSMVKISVPFLLVW